MAIAARLAKYGVSLAEVIWQLPVGLVNQLVIYDELTNGRKPRWATDGTQGAKHLDALFADALTAGN